MEKAGTGKVTKEALFLPDFVHN